MLKHYLLGVDHIHLGQVRTFRLRYRTTHLPAQGARPDTRGGLGSCAA